MKRFLPALAATTSLCLAGTLDAATFNFTNVGDFGSFSDSDFDLGTDPTNNGVADIVNIAVVGGQRRSTSAMNVDRNDGLDIFNISNGGVIQNTSANNKVLRFGGGDNVVNVMEGGTLGASTIRDVTVNLSGSGNYLIGMNNSASNNFFNNTTLNFDLTWTGQVYFGAKDFDGDTTFDESQDVLDWLDTTDGANRLFLNGIALTSSDLGTKFLLTEVTAGSGNEPTHATRDFGVSLTVVPEPGSLALLAMGGLLVARRRRDSV